MTDRSQVTLALLTQFSEFVYTLDYTEIEDMAHMIDNELDRMAPVYKICIKCFEYSNKIKYDTLLIFLSSLSQCIVAPIIFILISSIIYNVFVLFLTNHENMSIEHVSNSSPVLLEGGKVWV